MEFVKYENEYIRLNWCSFYNLRLNKVYYLHQKQKGLKMDEMTNEQFKTVLQMIIQIIKDSKSKEDVIEKIKALLDR